MRSFLRFMATFRSFSSRGTTATLKIVRGPNLSKDVYAWVLAIVQLALAQNPGEIFTKNEVGGCETADYRSVRVAACSEPPFALFIVLCAVPVDISNKTKTFQCLKTAYTQDNTQNTNSLSHKTPKIQVNPPVLLNIYYYARICLYCGVLYACFVIYHVVCVVYLMYFDCYLRLWSFGVRIRSRRFDRSIFVCSGNLLACASGKVPKHLH